MPEAEELFIDAARHATVAAQGIWQRWRGEPEPTPRWHLEDCRQRLVLLIEAVLGLRLPVRVAQPPAPKSLIAGLFRRRPVMPPIPLPANDSVSIYLPPSIDIVENGAQSNRDDYPLLAMLQALRCVRGSALYHEQCGSGLALELYLLAEARAADQALRDLLPGWRAPLDGLYARSYAALASISPRDASACEVLRLYRSMLESGEGVPRVSDAQQALRWANAHADAISDPRARKYRPWLADLVIGQLLTPEGMPAKFAGKIPVETQRNLQQATLSRRPRARNNDEEDDASPGPWMVQTSEPHEHAEDPLGLNRPLDREPGEDAEGDAQSLSELESARVVTTPGRSSQVLVGTDLPPRQELDTPDNLSTGGFIYPEWDCRVRAYRRQARVHARNMSQGSQEWADSALARHAAILRDVRRRLGTIRPVRRLLKRQTDGDDIDTDALVDERSEARAGGVPSGAVYSSRRLASRRLSLLLLIDASASTDAWVNGGQRVIDVEKEAALVAACALHEARADFAIHAFSGEGADKVIMRNIKTFEQPWDTDAMRRIAAVEPDRFTRLGGAVRHACTLLSRRPADYRMLLLFSDGKPNDCDRYASAYGLEDARQALVEVRAQLIEPYCFTVDREGSSYLPHLFGAGHYMVVRHAQQLPLAFVDWLRKAAQQASR